MLDNISIERKIDKQYRNNISDNNIGIISNIGLGIIMTYQKYTFSVYHRNYVRISKNMQQNIQSFFLHR